MAAGLAQIEKRKKIEAKDVEWVVNSGQYSPRPEKRVHSCPQVGCANGLAVYGPNMGTLMEIEAIAIPVERGKGKLTVTGIMEEEEMGGETHRLRRKATARGAVDNCLTVLKKYLGLRPEDFDIHINFPGGTPIDGPSAGITVATAIYSAITNIPVNNLVAMTGELSIRGYVKPVGGIVAKIEAAKRAGATTVIIPRENWQDLFKTWDVRILAVDRIEEVIEYALVNSEEEPKNGKKMAFAFGRN
jgi:Lon-like ATP-dependent protease